jgi:hypothetical protein
MGDSSSSTKTSQTNTLNPWSQGQYTNQASGIQSTLGGNYAGSYTPYTGQLIAGLTPLQQQAQTQAQNSVTAGQGLLGQAASGATSGASYAPSSVTPQTLASTNLSAYLNPYTQDVTNATMNALNLQNQQQINNEAGQFTSAGAFGGARQGVADAQTNNLFANTAAQTLAGLNQANYANAQQAAQSDISNNLQGQLANQQAGLQGANLNLGAAGLLGNLSGLQQQLGLNSANSLNSLGAEQQATQTAADQAAYQEALRGQINPQQQLAAQLGLLGETPMLTNSQGQSNTTYSPSLLSSIGQGVGIAGSLFGVPSGGGGVLGGVSNAANPFMSYLASMSDERSKENVVTIGRDAKGRRWVEFSYRNDPTRHIGVMAQEVQKTDPEAVVEHPILGLLMVDYAKLAEAA